MSRQRYRQNGKNADLVKTLTESERANTPQSRASKLYDIAKGCAALGLPETLYFSTLIAIIENS